MALPIPKTAAITDYRRARLRPGLQQLAHDCADGEAAHYRSPKHLPGFSYFVTMVARVDINDQAQKLFVVGDRHAAPGCVSAPTS